MDYENKQFRIKEDMIEKFKNNYTELGFIYADIEYDIYFSNTTRYEDHPDDIIQINVDSNQNWMVYISTINGEFHGFKLRVQDLIPIIRLYMLGYLETVDYYEKPFIEIKDEDYNFEYNEDDYELVKIEGYTLEELGVDLDAMNLSLGLIPPKCEGCNEDNLLCMEFGNVSDFVAETCLEKEGLLCLAIMMDGSYVCGATIGGQLYKLGNEEIPYETIIPAIVELGGINSIIVIQHIDTDEEGYCEFKVIVE